MQNISYSDILFIINPNSGGKKAAKTVKKITALELNLAYIITHNLAELDDVFKSNIEKYKLFIIVGGDGTVNHVLKYLYNRHDKIIGILPAGSGNGFAKELGFSKSVKSLLNDIINGETTTIDILSVNNNKCINIAGLGFDSFVAHSFRRSKSRGLRNYICYTLKAIFSFKPFDAFLTIDKKKFQDKFQMITIANSKQFGNNAIIVPQAKPNDGIFEVVLIKPFPFFLYPVFVFKLFCGSLKDSKYIRYFKVHDSVEIHSNFKKYHIDGEPLTFTDSLKITLLKSKVRIIKTSANTL